MLNTGTQWAGAPFCFTSEAVGLPHVPQGQGSATVLVKRNLKKSGAPMHDSTFLPSPEATWKHGSVHGYSTSMCADAYTFDVFPLFDFSFTNACRDSCRRTVSTAKVDISICPCTCRGFWSSVGFAPFYLMHLSRQQACVPLRLVTQVAELMCIQRFGIWGHRLCMAFI